MPNPRGSLDGSRCLFGPSLAEQSSAKNPIVIYWMSIMYSSTLTFEI
jgi:hypothetical protein